MTLEADVVVVGSGAGGGVVAAELAAAGRSVVVLEAGPFVDEASMPTNELDAFVQLYLEPRPALDLGRRDHDAGRLGRRRRHARQLDDDASRAGRRPRRVGTDHGLDGLATARAGRPTSAAIEAELGRRARRPSPPKDEVILRGAAALGWEAAPTRRNAADCGDCGSCPFGCPRGAKQSGIRAHLATAAAARAPGSCPGSRVTRVLIEGGRAVGVEGTALVPDPATGEPIPDPAGPAGVRVRPARVRAPQVVVAAGALRTPAVLQASGLDHPAIGRHLRIHPVPVVLARSADAGRHVARARCRRRGRSSSATRPTGRNGYVIESAPGHPGLLALALPWEGAAPTRR